MPRPVTLKDWSALDETARAAAHPVLPFSRVELVEQKALVELLKSASEEELAAMEKAGVDPSEPERVIPYVFSDEGRDRDGDRLLVRGWELQQFRKNPVILPSHDYGHHVVGRSLRTWKDMPGGGAAKKLRGLVQYVPKDVDPFAYMLYELARDGYQKAGSVGFQPIEYERDPDLSDDERQKYPWGGLLFKRQTLLEFSPTAVPSNPNALAGAKSAGIDVAPLGPWAERILDHEQAVPVGLTSEQVEQAYRVVSPTKTLIHTEDPERTAKEIERQLSPETQVPAPKTVLVLAAEAQAATARLEAAVKEQAQQLEKSLEDVRVPWEAVDLVVRSVLGAPSEKAATETKPEEPQRNPYEGVAEVPAEPKAKTYSLEELAEALKGQR